MALLFISVSKVDYKRHYAAYIYPRLHIAIAEQKSVPEGRVKVSPVHPQKEHILLFFT